MQTIMQTAVQFFNTAQQLFGSFFFLFCFLAATGFSFWLCYFLTVRQNKLGDQARAAAALIYDECQKTRASFRHSYMPLSVGDLLEEAEQLRQELEQRSWSIERRAALAAIEAEASVMVKRIQWGAAAFFTTEAREGDRLVLLAELAAIEAAAAAAEDEILVSCEEALSQVASNLKRARLPIFRSQARLAAVAG